MKQIKLIPITICVLTASLTACQKQDTTVATPEEVQITITTPQEGNIYKKGDTVNITASISSITQLHGYIVRITDVGTENVLLFETEGHTHDGNLTVNKQWVNTLDYATDLQLELICIIDHDENKKNAKVDIKIQP